MGGGGVAQGAGVGLHAVQTANVEAVPGVPGVGEAAGHGALVAVQRRREPVNRLAADKR